MKKPTKTKPFPDRNKIHRPETDQGAMDVFELQSEVSYRLKNILPDVFGEKESEFLKPPYLHLFYHLDELLRTLIHDGRNRLGPIKGYASLIGSKVIPGSLEAQWTKRIIENIEGMERHLHLLSIYQMKGASLVTETNCADVIHDALETINYLHNREIPIEVTNNVIDVYPLHREVLKRLLIHVIRNAWESNKEQKKIIISASTDLKGLSKKNHPPTILFKVTDKGRGIADSKKSSIWKPFYTTKPNHFGLGLTYAKMSASILGASIELHSTEGHGTSVSIRVQSKGG